MAPSESPVGGGGEMTAVEHCRYKIEEIGGQPLEG